MTATRGSPTSTRTDVAAVLALLLVPWSVQLYAGNVPTLLFAWGLVGLDPFVVTALPDFLFRYTAGLPQYLLAWPTSVLVYLLALGSAALGAVAGREDVRVTAGLLVAVGVLQASLAWGFSVQPGRAAAPLGTALCWAVAWWRYRSALGLGRRP